MLIDALEGMGIGFLQALFLPVDLLIRHYRRSRNFALAVIAALLGFAVFAIIVAAVIIRCLIIPIIVLIAKVLYHIGKWIVTSIMNYMRQREANRSLMC